MGLELGTESSTEYNIDSESLFVQGSLSHENEWDSPGGTKGVKKMEGNQGKNSGKL